MLKPHTFAIAAAFALSALLSPALAAPKTIETVLLEAIVVTPTAHYSASEWQARVEARSAIVAVTLEPVIVTPTARYTLAQWQQHQAGLAYAKQLRQKGLRGWLQAVWKHFQFAHTPVEV